MAKVKSTKHDEKIYVYAQNAILKLASFEKEKYKEWLDYQKSNKEEGSFIYAFQLYMSHKDMISEEYVAKINSMYGNSYMVRYDGEIIIKNNNGN